ncbi:MAG: NUDIX hydrolase [Pseudomonadota bacterium]
MSLWRPPQSIRVISIGLHWRKGRLLACEVTDDSGAVKGVRPLGGAVEFGETWQTALKREFQEELGIGVSVGGPPIVMENIFVHEGVTGHEIVFAAEVLFPEGAFRDQTLIRFIEDSNASSVARWFDLDELDATGVELYPTGLRDRLTA